MRVFWLLAPMLVLSVTTPTAVRGQAHTKIIDSGPDGEKLVFAVLGDGYTEAELPRYKQDVDKLVVNGVFAHDFYADHRRAFNVYRIDLKSRESGVSTPDKGRNTALRTVFTGQWESAWIEESPQTDGLINSAASALNKFDYVLVVLNEQGWGGVRRGIRMYVTANIPWNVVAHEYGHGIGGLFDEYTGKDVSHPTIYIGPPLNYRNISTVLDREKVVWRGMIQPGTPVPTDGNAPNFDSNKTVGMFRGGHYCDDKVYRPVDNCRMRSNEPLFCPVCEAVMRKTVMPFMGNPPAGAAHGALGAPRPGDRDDAKAGAGEAEPAAAIRGGGAAGQPQTGPAAGASYITMLIKVTEGGECEVLSAREVQGRLIPNVQATSPFVATIADGGQPVAVQPLPDDPFVVRGITDPDKKKGEKISRAKHATIVINVAKDQVAAVVPQKLGIQIYRIDAAISDEPITASFLAKLKDDKKVQPYLATQPLKPLGPQMMTKIGESKRDPGR